PVAEEFRNLSAEIRLQSSSQLVRMLERSQRPLDVHGEKVAGLQSLTETERRWLADSVVQLLVPMLNSKNRLIGVLGITSKLSEGRFSTRDVATFESVASSGALVVENFMRRTTGSSAGDGDLFSARLDSSTSRLCATCGSVYPNDGKICSCGQPTTPLD